MIVALAGGVGGAKMAHGLSLCLPPEQLTVVVNTADDFDWYELRVCPDLDTVMYTLGGVANTQTGWGVSGDTFVSLDTLQSYGEDAWFRIGDKDLATHVLRTDLLRRGHSLTEATERLAGALNVGPALLPMTDDRVATVIETPDGKLDFQEYFVRHHHSPTVTGVSFGGVERARCTDRTLSALRDAQLIVFCPSNPIVSIGPILAVPGFKEALAGSSAPKVAVSPIVAGHALRGPADRMLTSLGYETSAYGVATLYREAIQGLVIDRSDVELEARIRGLGVEVLVTDTVMQNVDDRRALARDTLQFGRSLVSADVEVGA